jgi:hypothetical protein
MDGCPICGRRPPKRFCPAKAEKICALCCGREREVTIDCPSDCSHLISARRYESEHRKPLSADEFPYRDAEFSMEFIYERWPAISVIASAILSFQAQNRELHDGETNAAIEAMAETYRTLGAGIYYERPPAGHLARALYSQMTQHIQEFRNSESGPGESPSLKDTDIFHLLVFLLRIARREINGRPRSHAFLDFLRAQFPAPPQAAKETSRIILA